MEGKEVGREVCIGVFVGGGGGGAEGRVEGEGRGGYFSFAPTSTLGS